MTLYINEQFVSIQGEGINTGIPMYFIRLQGCSVGCYFCDTKYSWRDGVNDQSVNEIDLVNNVVQSGLGWVCITGGEPLEQDIQYLLRLLRENRLNIHVETSGCVKRQDMSLVNWLVLSPKELFSKSSKTDEYYKRSANEIKVLVTKLSDLDYYLDEYRDIRPFTIQVVDNDIELIAQCIDIVKPLSNVRIMIQSHKFMGVR